MYRNELVTIAQRLREYVGNPHHVDPMSDAFKALIGDAANVLSQSAQPQGEPVAYVDYSASGGVRWRHWEHGNLADGAPLFSGSAEQPAPVAVDDNVEFEKWWMSTPILRKQKIQVAQEAWFARANLSK